MPDKNEVLRCDFCSRKSDEVAYLIANPGNSAFICDDCAREALSATGRESTTRSTDLLKERVLRGRTLKGVDDFLRCDFCTKKASEVETLVANPDNLEARFYICDACARDVISLLEGQDYSRITSILAERVIRGENLNDELRHHAMETRHFRLLVEVAQSLAGQGDEELRPVVAALASDDPDDVSSAKEILIHLGSKTAILSAVRNIRPAVRKAAVSLVEEIGDSDALSELLNDNDPDVRAHATQAFERMQELVR